jgi:pyruvate,water dikinase
MKKAFVRWFGEIGIDDVPSVGGKNASLGEMYRELGSRGVKVPNGFAVTRTTLTVLEAEESQGA